MAELLLHKELELFFRGKRDYIYGPDLFDKAVKAIFEYFDTTCVQHIDFSSHDMTRFGLDFFLYTEPQDEVSYSYHSKLFFSFKGVKYFSYLVKNEKEVIEREPYPEEDIISVSTLDPSTKSISINSKTPFLLTDNYTALTKQLHYQLFPEIEGKWIFVRVVYPEYQEGMNYASLKVVNRRMFGKKYTQNALLLDDNNIGSLYFTLI